MKYTRIMFFLVLATVATAYARFAQLYYLTEPGTGFFKSDSNVIALALSVFIVLAAIACAVMTIFTRRKPAGTPEKSVAPRIGAVILAAASVADLYLVRYVSSAGFLIILTRIFAIISALSLLFYILRFYSKPINRISRLAYLPIVIFFALKLVTTFTVYAGISAISENVFYIAFLCCALVFMLYFLKLENEISSGRTAYRLFPLGVVTFIAGVLCCVPQAVLLLLGKETLIHNTLGTLIFPAATAVFALCYTLALYSKKNIVRHKRNTPKLEVDASYHELNSQFISGGGKHIDKKR